MLARFNEAGYLTKRAAPLHIISSNQGSSVSGLLIRESEAKSVSVNKRILSKIPSESHAMLELRNHIKNCGSAYGDSF